MSSRSGSTAASAYPAAAAIRPQLASDPKIAVFTRLSRAMVRATVTASSSVAAPVTRTVIRLVTPSASACIWRARSRHTAANASVNTTGSAATPDAPEASTSTVSFVDMQPSTCSRSKLTRTAARSASSRTGESTTASVVSTVSMVAIEGAIIPAPLVVPPMLHPSAVCAACFATVSVVMIAVAAASPAAGVAARAACACSTPASTRPRGSWAPISPVEQIATSIAPAPSS